MARISDTKKLVSPGQLYAKIKVSKGSDEGYTDTRLQIAKMHWYVQICRNFIKNVRLTPEQKKAATFTPDYHDAFEFLNWDLQAWEFNAAISQVTTMAFIAAAMLAGIVYFGANTLVVNLAGGVGSEFLAAIYVLLGAAALAFTGVFMFQRIPLQEAKSEQIKALTYVPEILGYMVMSMKLVPNLERAVEFAASHGKGRIAEEFQEILWGLSTGKYNSLSEALDELSERWGTYSPDFREALHKIRQSVLEDGEGKRFIILDKTMEDILASVKQQMEIYARSLSQPTTMLFYLGVLLPMILVIILPVGSAFSGTPMARLEPLVLLYNFLIPGMAFAFAYKIIQQRPPTYAPPKIPDNHPKLPPKYTAFIGGGKVDIRVFAILFLFAGVGVSYYFHSFGVGLPDKCLLSSQFEPFPEPIPGSPFSCFLQDQSEPKVLQEKFNNPDYFSIDETKNGLYAKYISSDINADDAKRRVILERSKFFLQPENDISPSTFVFGFLLSLAAAIALFLHFLNVYKRKVQLEVLQMEREFKEAIYIIASRMAENKPIEDAMKKVKAFLPRYAISDQLFEPTTRNIEILGMPLEDAFFDADYGSLKDNASTIIRSSVRLMVDSVNLGVTVAARTLISLSSQLSNSEKVNQNLKVLVSDVTGTMRIMALFIGPMILGITTGLQRVVMIVLAQVISNAPSTAATTTGTAADSFLNASLVSRLDPEAFAQLVSPLEFQLIIAIYLVEIVLVLIFFTTKIEEDNDILFQMNLSRGVFIAMTVYLVAIVLSTMLVGTFVGG